MDSPNPEDNPDSRHEKPRPLEMTGLLGVFTQTLLPSPVIQWILPARLRSKHHNDVVFVGQKRVQIKDAVAGGYLEDVIEKTDFGGSIIAAKVLNVSAQLPWESQLQTKESAAGKYVNPELLDSLPSQILVLSLDMKELLFLCCSPSVENAFITFRRPLPVDVGLAEKFGKHIAVDPKSRAVAISASSDHFGLFRLKSPGEIQLQLAKGDLNPINKEHFYRCEGKLMFMEFLYPKTAEDGKIILLIIVARGGATYASIFEWEEDGDIAIDAPAQFDFKLPKQDRLPTMIVPLAKETSFLLVTTTSMAVYSPTNYVRPTRYPLIAPNAEVEEAGLWTRWARPTRNWLYSQRYDGIYLCREDGWIYYLEFGNEGELESQTSLGQLHCDVDTAFDVLDMGHEGGDFILAAGSMGDGGLFVQEARDHPKCIQRFLNWAPVTDAVMIRPDSKRPQLQKDVSRDRLFACSASSSGHGAIHELRYGVEAQTGVGVPLDHLSGIRDMWAISDDANGGIYVLISDPRSTLLLCMNSDLDGGISALDEDETGLDNAQTLAADCTPGGVLIQVTEKASHLFVPHNLPLNTHIPHGPDTVVVAADVDGPNSAMITAVRHENELSLRFTRVIETDKNVSLDVGQPLAISSQPICLSLEKFGGMTFVFMGTGSGTLRVFRVDNGTITYFCKTKVSIGDNDEISPAIESLAVIRITLNGTLRAFLLCGLRSGILVPFEIDFRSSSLISLQQQEPKRIGTTSIWLQSKDAFALLLCGNELWRVSYPLDGLPLGCLLRRVWITDQNNPAYFPITLHGFGLINPESETILGPLFCFADRQLLICALDLEAKMVPRRIGLPGTATKLTHSQHLRSLIVSYNVTEAEDPLVPYHSTTRSYLEFVDPDSQQAVVPREKSDTRLPWGSCGETITCILDWMFEKHGHKYHLIVIGTSLPPLNAQGPLQGRVVILHASRDPSDSSQMKCVTKHVQTVSGPVRAIAPFRDSLIIGAGSLLFPLTSKSAETRWARDAARKLPSAAVAITVYGPFIFVTTARHGFMVYEAVDGVLKCREWDEVERDGVAHYICPGSTPLAFMSSRGGVVRVSKLGRDPDTTWGPVSSPAEIRLSDTVLRFVLDSKDELTPMTPWQRGSSMYGLALNGAVYRFFLLRKNELQLLWLLQNMCLKDQSICPSVPSRDRRMNPLWREPRADNCRIDGDILARLTCRGPEYLEQMVVKLDASRETAFFGPHIRELTGEVLGESWNHAKHVIHWLRTLLQVQI